MSDALPFGTPRRGTAAGRERDARIEALLLAGLDQYFAGEFEQAINVWTRVLFLDRSHARARAYIERARGAVAERQRHADELVHHGAEALERGDRHTARRLLTSAEKAGGGEEALALLSRLDRLDAAVHADAPAAVRVPVPADPPPTAHPPYRLRWAVAGVAAGIVIAVLAGWSVWSDPLDTSAVGAVVPIVHDLPPPMPATCEIRLFRARRLAADGKTHEALALLEEGDPDGLHRSSFNELRAALQQTLIAAGRRQAGFAVSEPPR